MDRRVFERLLLLAVALPGGVVVLVTGVSGTSALLTDRPLLLAPVPTSIAEAAGNRDVADVIVRVQSGESIDAPGYARIPLRLHDPAMLTPLEAAVISERAYMITLVRNQGATLDAPMLRRLRCIAHARRDRGTMAYLDGLDSSPLSCEGVNIPY
jgi:hypothetical protein